MYIFKTSIFFFYAITIIGWDDNYKITQLLNSARISTL